jgi:hypothetical protein
MEEVRLDEGETLSGVAKFSKPSEAPSPRGVTCENSITQKGREGKNRAFSFANLGNVD